MDLYLIVAILLVAIPSIINGFVFMFYQKKIDRLTKNNNSELAKKLHIRKLIISSLISLPFFVALSYWILLRS